MANASLLPGVIQDIRQQLEAITDELKTQFQRIAQIQAQLDHLHEMIEPSARPRKQAARTRPA